MGSEAKWLQTVSMVRKKRDLKEVEEEKGYYVILTGDAACKATEGSCRQAQA
jgi:hypothetical protein